nr:MAG TPA: hypothetical protein [Caudoviricetes sp.]
MVAQAPDNRFQQPREQPSSSFHTQKAQLVHTKTSLTQTVSHSFELVLVRLNRFSFI